MHLAAAAAAMYAMPHCLKQLPLQCIAMAVSEENKIATPLTQGAVPNHEAPNAPHAMLLPLAVVALGWLCSRYEVRGS